MEHLKIKSLGPIKDADIKFADFTLFVGPQASGKSILLQLIKLIIDRYNIPSVLKQNNYEWGKKNANFLDLFFGESMSAIWKPETEIEFDGKKYVQSSFLSKQGTRIGSRTEKLFYIPAQRVVTMSQGWPRAFGTFDIGDPFVLKQFSETIRVLMEKETTHGGGKQSKVFPKPNRIKEPLRKMLDDSIFHGAKVESDNSSLKRRFLLEVGNSKLPFMTWSAGQKEFMPLLLSLYHLMPSAKVKVKQDIQAVIVEEPEMGLHPQAIQALMVVFLELIARGYKIIISTHSPVLLELLWAMNYIKKYKGTSEDLFDLFSQKNNSSNASIKPTFEKVINDKTFATYFFEQHKEGVTIKNISTLDAGNEDNAIANWGGLTDFASKAGNIISKLVANEREY
ncbi:MAG: AAA family ATPase [Flavobacterium sp.]|nr:AAA family ATPase [Flavobacterium sp.]